MVEFYPSITDTLLNEAINFAKDTAGANISSEERHIIMHARKAFLFHRNPNNGEVIPWQKRNGDFDVTMGAPDGAEVCELVGLYILHKVKADPRLKKLNFGLYRDDGLGIHP